MSACRRLPQELIAAIVDNIQNDRTLLKAFSLVCRAWTNPARDRLFSTLKISENFFDRLDSTELNVPSIFTPFLRHLHVTATPLWSKAIPFLVDFQTPRLRTLMLSSPRWHSLMPSERSAFLSRFGSITTLRLDAWNMTFAEVADLFCSLPHLETLLLRCEGMDYKVPPAPSPRLSLPERFTTLGVYLSPIKFTPFLEWLVSFPQPPRLRTLYLLTLCSFSVNAPSINEVLKALGPSLETIRSSTVCAEVFCPHSIAFTYNTHLRCLHLDFHDAYDVSDKLRFATNILSQMPSATLETIIFNIDASSDPETAAWIGLDAILAHPRFATLKEVRICICPWPDTATYTRASFATLLPACSARGIVSFRDTLSWQVFATLASW